LMHGKKSVIKLNTNYAVFKGLPAEIEAARYHSLIANRETIESQLEVIAEDDIGEIMGVKHRNYDVYGLQFHPESILTPKGEVIMRNFLSLGGGKND